MAVDKWGYCHALWGTEEKITIGGQELSSFSFKNNYITVINPQGVVEATIDLTDSLGKEGITTECFAVDNEGNYYVENRSEVLKIASDGSYLDQIACDGIVEGSREVKLLISGKDLPVDGMEISGKGFLGDGRLCILEGDADKKVFHYVLVEMGI